MREAQSGHMLRIVLLATLLTGCNHELARGPEPRDVHAWAQLDENLGRRASELSFGEADGRSILGSRVLVLNGEEMVCFVRAHGFARDEGIVAARKLRTVTEIDVVIVGRDGARLKLTLRADGAPQGAG